MEVTPEREQELRARYDAASTHKERSQVEAEVWLEHRREAREEGREAGHPAEAIASFFTDVSRRAIDDRRRMLLAGDLAEPLWDLVDGGDLPLSTAVFLLRDAKNNRIHPETVSHSLRRMIAEYYARPYQRDLGGGKVSRFRTPQRGTSDHSRPRRASNGEGDRDRSSDRPPAQGDGSQEFWKTLRSLCMDYARGRLQEHSPEAIDELVRTLETDVRVAFEHFRLRVRNAHAPMRVVLSRRHITDACRTLLIDPPRSLQNVPPSFRSLAKRQFRNLAREYHPDSHGGSETTRERYEAVVAAWNTLEEFFRSGLAGQKEG